jgi:hypothetical protein
MLEFFTLFIVGIVWGSTNFLISQSYYDIDKIKEENIFKRVVLILKSNYKPIIYYVLNQLGSVLFYICLGKISKTI